MKDRFVDGFVIGYCIGRAIEVSERENSSEIKTNLTKVKEGKALAKAWYLKTYGCKKR